MSMSALVRELSDSLAAGEFGDCREILDEILDEMIDLCVVDSDFPQGDVDVILATQFSFCPVDGWGYDEGEDL